MADNFLGVHALDSAVERLFRSGFFRPFVVASRGALSRIRQRPAGSFFDLPASQVFSDFHPNPSSDDIMAGSEQCRTIGPDLVVALGGGSAIDVAKTIRAVSHAQAPFDPGRVESLKPGTGQPPLAAIPTTAGSGSEATHFAVYYHHDVKKSLAHPSLVPDIAVVDPALSGDMPPALTAATGFDALSQAVESHWARGATAASRAHAVEAVLHVLPHIARAVNRPDPECRLHMALGAFAAGSAINISKTTAPHALSYFITKRYGLPHGHAVALTMPFFFLLNSGIDSPAAETDIPRSPTMRATLQLLGASTPREGAALWRALMRECGLPATLQEAGIDGEQAIREIVSNVNVERLANNPAEIDGERLIRLMVDGLAE